MRKLFAPPSEGPPATRREEIRSFAFLAMVMVPVLTVALIAGYGFLVWIYQMFAGPPGG